jgi:2-oxoisovalerate dehydrogenase E1 component beta subunit
MARYEFKLPAYEWAYFPGPKRMKKALEKVMAD